MKLTKETILHIGTENPKNFPAFSVGDTIAVSHKVKEGDKERIQTFEGDIIAMHKNGISSTFVIRKISANAVAVEKIFPFYSPVITDIKFVRHGKVRRAKLYYMRNRVGKGARVQELIMTKEQKQSVAGSAEKIKKHTVA